jgi:hypothetical protein
MSVLKNAKAIGVSAKVFENFKKVISVSTKDLSQDQIQEIIQRRLQNLGNAFAGMVPGLKSMRANGEQLMDTLARVAVQLRVVNRTWRVLGFDLFDVSVKGAMATNAIVKIFGNVQNFIQATSFYFDQFYTDQEKIKELRKQLTAGFDRAGVGGKLPKSIEAYRKLVDKLESQGRDKAAAMLIKLAPLFVNLQDALGGVTDEVNSLKNALDPNDFSTLFAYQVANGKWLNGTLKREPAKPGIYSAPTANRVAASTSPAVNSSNGAANTAAPNAGSENNDALLVQVLQQLRKIANINVKWDRDGLPDVRLETA